MELLKDRRVVLATGIGGVVAAGLLAAVVIALFQDDPDPAASMSSGGGLTVQTGKVDDVGLDPKRPLRCFSGGRFVGEMPVEDCARRNGVPTGALDLGLDNSGALAASNGPTAEITPLPPAPPPAISPAADSESPVADETSPRGLVRPAGQVCWRYDGTSWTQLSSGGMSLGACVEALFQGECLGPNAAAYGRWGARTLRLAAGRIETSSDNRTFKTMASQGPGCTTPPVG
jgi:hypothetical protein